MAENYNLGTAYGTIELNASALSRAAAGFDLLGNKMLLMGGAALAGFGYAVKSAADFEQQMSRFKAVGNATANQMDTIREKSLQLGRDSAYGASEVVKAFTELAYAGKSTQEIMAGLGDATVYLAAAGEIPLATAAQVLVQQLNAFSKPASDAVHFANEIARAANASTISIDDLNTSLRYIGPTAAQMGLSFRDTTQAIAILGNEGIKGSTAGTSLRGVLVGLINDSKPAREAMHELGLDTNEVGNNFFTADGKLRNFKQISEILRGAIGGLADKVFDANGHLKKQSEIDALLESSTLSLTDKVKLQAFSHIFQRRAMGAAFALAKDGRKAFDDLANSAQYNTTAQDIMKTKLDNLNGSIKILKASLETFGIVVGSQFTPYLKAAADVLRQIVNVFIRLPAPVQKLIGGLLLFGGSFLVVGGAMAKISSLAIKSYGAFVNLGKGLQLMGGLISNFVRGMQLLGTTLLTNPVFLFIAALVILAVIFYLLYTRSETFRRGIHRIGEAAKEAGRWLLQAFKTAWEWIKANWPDLLLILLGPVGAAIIAWRHFKDQILDALKKVWDWIKSNWDLLTPLLLGPFGLVIIIIRRFGHDIVEALKTALNKVKDFFEKLPYYAGYAVGYMIGLIAKFVVNMTQMFVKLWNKLLDLVIQFVADFIRFILNLVLQAPGFFTQMFTQILTAMINWVAQMIAKVVELGVRVILTIIQFFGQLPGMIFGFLMSALGTMIGWVGQMAGAAARIGSEVVDRIVGFFTGLPGKILHELGDGYNLLLQWGKDVMQGALDGLKSIGGGIGGFVSSVGKGIVSGAKSSVGAKSPSTKMMTVGEDVMKGLIIGLKRYSPQLDRFIVGMGGQMTGVPLASYGGRPQPAPAAGATYNTTINNPVAETSEESISRTMQKLAYVGIAG